MAERTHDHRQILLNKDFSQGVRSVTRACLSLVSLFWVCALAFAAGPQVVSELPQSPMVLDPNAGSSPSGLVGAGGRIYFSMTTPAAGYELWTSDGTTAGTQLVKDIAPGDVDAFPEHLTMVGQLLYFTAGDGQQPGLWKSDGSAQGTVLVKAGISPLVTAALRDLLFFVTDNGVDGAVLWSSDGSPQGTTPVLDDNGDTIATGGPLVTYGGAVYFPAPNGTDLWRSDGTHTSTVHVNSGLPNFDGVGPRDLFVAGGYLYFTAPNAEGGSALWRSDGSDAGTKFVRSGFVNSGVAVGNVLYFIQPDDVDGDALWKTDGTPEGTMRVKIPAPGESSGALLALCASTTQLFFVARSPGGRYGLWRSDGSEAGSVPVRDINPDGDDIDSCAGLGEVALFAGHDGRRSGLWRSDGSAGGTLMLNDEGTPRYANPSYTATSLGGGTLFFFHETGNRGLELWRTDGTVGGTYAVKALRDGGGSLRTFTPQAVGDRLVFSSYAPAQGVEPWVSDGTLAGTVNLNDVTPGADGSNFSAGVTLDGTLLFRSDDGVHGAELWKTDASAQGTVLVKDIASGAGGSSLDAFTVMNGVAYFSANDGSHGLELWKSNGLEEGTTLLKDIAAGPRNGAPRDLVAADKILFFSAEDDAHGRELYRSDGAAEGTRMVRDIVPGADGANPRDLIAAGGKVFFTADDGVQGRGWWVSDGSAQGTLRLTAFNRYAPYSELTRPLVFGGALYFIYQDDSHGAQLWTSDGTVAGTHPFEDLMPGEVGSEPMSLTRAGTHLFFIGPGGHLYASDGTASGTRVLAPIRPIGVIFSGDMGLVAVGDSVYFIAVDGVHGTELWVSGGTPANTVRVSDTFGDSDTNVGLNVSRYAQVGEQLYLVATNPDRLWIYGMDADGDGLSDQREIELGTFPDNTDSDGDTMADGSDAFPTDPSESADNNHNGLGDNGEADFDGDGLPGAWETSHGLNPQDADDAGRDDDEDGLDNRAEYRAGTDPHNADSDSDGANDGAEVARGFDPTDGMYCPRYVCGGGWQEHL